MKIIQTQNVDAIFDSYPKEIKKEMIFLRELVFSCGKKLKLTKLEETLKWGEPSYIAKYGSTLRMDWKEKTPNQYALYFSCNSSLIPTFKSIFGNALHYEGNRAIIFNINEPLPKEIIAQCITCALQYHLLKKDPFLGLI